MRVQITFAKTEAMRFTSHLDLHHALVRTLRRAEIPVAYSQGHNPRPRLSLASALPLGVTSQGELAEVWLATELPVLEIFAALQKRAPPGIEFIEVASIPDDSPKLTNRIQAAEYQLTLLSPPPDLDSRVADMLAATRLPRTRKDKSYDLRPLIESLQVTARERNGCRALILRLAARPAATGRADEVLAELGIPTEEARIHRRRLILAA